MKKYLGLGIGVLVACVAVYELSSSRQSSVDMASTQQDPYTRAQHVLETRCTTCHGCYSSPCQMNFQSAEGILRGANKLRVYGGAKVLNAAPTRLGIDGHSVAEWQAMGFFDVINSNLLRDAIDLKSKNPTLTVSDRADTAVHMCPANAEEMQGYKAEHPERGMPYGMAALNPEESRAITDWLDAGARLPATTQAAMPADVTSQVQSWNEFFNRPDPRQKVVSRFIYEHLFLAHVYFEKAPRTFFRMVRSSTSCESRVTEIPTRMPNEDPRTPNLYYCLTPLTLTVVEKNHLPYKLSPQKMDRYKQIFDIADLTKPGSWAVAHMPDYHPFLAGNPFIAFQDIPVRGRYQFLLDEAHYHVATFIRGPVCDGNVALNVIQEQFYVFFINPDADPMVQSKAFADSQMVNLQMPGSYGHGAKSLSPTTYAREVVGREAYRSARAAIDKKFRPLGHTLNDVWDGEGTNDNAMLTVLRHEDSAIVMKGARGDASKTAFVLDYSIFERIVYDLTVNFDVYGNAGHQIWTRRYMDLLRMEGEELFLSFLPPSERREIRKNWYQGEWITTLKMEWILSLRDLDRGTQIQFKSPNRTKVEFMNKVIFERLSAAVRGPVDNINWKKLTNIEPSTLTPTQQELRALSGVRASHEIFPSFFPNFSLIQIVDKEGNTKELYSVVRNKEMKNISWMFQEEKRRKPQDDSLMFFEGIAGSYPEHFFRVNEDQLSSWAQEAKAITTQEAYAVFKQKWGVSRMHSQFWMVYDQIQHEANKFLQVQAGILDLSRYQ